MNLSIYSSPATRVSIASALSAPALAILAYATTPKPAPASVAPPVSSDGIARLIQVTQLKNANANDAALSRHAGATEVLRWGDPHRSLAAAFTFAPATEARIDTPAASVSGPRSRAGSAAAAATGVADLAMELGAGAGLSRAQRTELESTIDRVVQDVCLKSKPGDNLIGSIRTAVGFALWGAGVAPEKIGAVTADLSRLLTRYFPGDSEKSMKNMGQYFHAHNAWELILTDKLSGLGQFFPAAR